MPLDENSSPDEINGAFRNNSDYDIAASRTKAGVFIQACRIFVADPSRLTAGEHSLEYSITQIAELLNQALRWWNQSRGPTFVDLSRSRD